MKLSFKKLNFKKIDFKKVKSYIKENIYSFLIMAILDVTFIVSPENGFFLSVLLIFIMFFYAFMEEKTDWKIFLNAAVILLLILFFGYKTPLGDTNMRPVVSITQNRGDYYAEYEVNNTLKVEKYDSIPVCENYAIVDKVYNLKVLFAHSKVMNKNKIECIKDVNLIEESK